MTKRLELSPGRDAASLLENANLEGILALKARRAAPG
jgi:hypothetical protein